MIDLAITGCGTFTPEGDSDKPDLGLLDRSLRRGLSDVTRLFMHAAQGALKQSGVPAQAVHVVFGSAFGEIATAEAMLAQAFDENDASPARFRNSVHNTAPGLYSISVKSTRPCTAISAGFETVAFALLEAQMLLADDAEHVLVVLAEEAVPSALSLEYTYGKLAAAFVATRPERAPHALARLTRLRRAASGEPARPHASGDHPLEPALALARAIEAGQRGTVPVGDGDPRYVLDVEPGGAP